MKVMDLMKGVQDVIRCDVCIDNEWEKLLVEVYCNMCYINVCSFCVVRYMVLDKFKKYDIVFFYVVSIEIILLLCFFYIKLKCDLFCKKCLILICFKCFFFNYNSYIVEEVIELC